MTETKSTRKAIIKCPYCGWEYTAADIFMPGDLIGKPTDVVRDALGKILYQYFEEGEEPEHAEHFICDNCDRTFVVEPVVSYKVHKEEDALDFSTTEASLLD